MIEYLKHLFTKPVIAQTPLDKLAIAGIVIGGLIILTGLIFLVSYVIYKIVIWRRRKKNAKN